MADLPKSWRSKADNYNCFFKSTVFVTGLAVAQKYVNYAVVGVLITFFTDTMVGVNLLESAFLTNLQEGVSGFMLIAIANISGSIVSHLKVVLYSTTAYITGLVLLGISAYHVIPEGKLGLYYKIIVFVIAMGTAGSEPMLEKFFQAQLEKVEEEEGKEKTSERVEDRLKAWKAVVWIISLLPIYLFRSYGWQKTIVLSASMMTATVIFFLLGTNFYKKPIKLIHTPFFVLLKVFKASFLKRNLQYPHSPHHFFLNNGNHLTFPPHIHFFRWVEKAAVIEFPPYRHTSPEQQVEDGRLCPVSQVKDSKLLLRMFPKWASFAGVGLVEVTANTFFPEQANNMVTGVSISLLLVASTLSKVLVTNAFDYLAKRLSRSPKKRFTIFRVFVGLFAYVFCFVLARKVEIKKLEMVEDHQIQDDPTAIMDVSTWKLGPQFFLLGCASGLAIDGLAKFYDHQVPQTMKGQADALIDGFISGFGSILSIICCRIYKRWFGDSLNSSRLDRYFFVIILVSIVNLMVCTVVLLTYPYNKVVEAEGGGGGAELQEVAVAAQTAIADTATEKLQEIDMLGAHGAAVEDNLEPQIYNMDGKEEDHQ